MAEEEKFFFHDFKKQRESKDISVDDIIKETKIQKHYIIAIEEGDFSKLPKVYIKLFLKSYCKYIGIDEHKILNEYNDYIKGNKKTALTNKTPKFIENKNKMNSSQNIDDSLNKITNSYFIQPQKIFSFLFGLLIIFIAWLTISNISKKNHKEILSDSKKISWPYIDNLSEVDSQYVEINNLKSNNIFKYEALDKSNKIIIDADDKSAASSKILNQHDQYQENFKNNIRFGIKHGLINLFINEKKIIFNHDDMVIEGYLEKKSTDKNQLIIKYLK